MADDVALRQSARISTAAIVVVSLVVATVLDPATFAGPVATFVLCYLPVQIVLAGMWARHPGWLAEQSRAVRGATLLLAALGMGAVAELVFVATVGGGQGAGTPQIAMFSIVTVVATFLLVVVFECWPFAGMPNRAVGTAGLLISAYALALLLYYLLFDLSFLPPPAQTPQTPTGAFNAWYVLTFLVTAITAMFLPPAFGFAGFERLRQPVRGLVGSLLCLVWASLLFALGVGVAWIDPVDFLVWVPVPLLFGGLIVLVVFRDSLFGGEQRRVRRGITNTLASAAVGLVLVGIYRLAAELVSPALAWGPPTYQGQVWIASATLALTFPLLATHADFFDHWPLLTTAPAEVGAEVEELPNN